MYSRNSTRLLFILLALLLVVVACRRRQQEDVPTPAATAEVQATEPAAATDAPPVEVEPTTPATSAGPVPVEAIDWPPQVITSDPLPGQEVALDLVAVLGPLQPVEDNPGREADDDGPVDPMHVRERSRGRPAAATRAPPARRAR